MHPRATLRAATALALAAFAVAPAYAAMSEEELALRYPDGPKAMPLELGG